MDMEAKVVKTFPTSSKLRAVVNVTIDDCFVVHGVKIFDSAKGQFVSMPNVKVGNHYVDTFHAINPDARAYLVGKVMKAWDQYQGIQTVQPQQADSSALEAVETNMEGEQYSQITL